MPSYPDDENPEPPLFWLILKGLGMIGLAFVAAWFILFLHTPSGH